MKYRQPNRKENVLTFGNYPTVSLADAREAREVARALLAEGKDPAVEREIRRQRIAQAHSETFKAIAQEAMKLKKAGWSASHHKRVNNCLAADVYPYIGSLPVASLSSMLILSVVQRVEKRGALEMARRVLEAISSVLKYAAATGRIQSNPADGLSEYLQDRPPVKHHPHVDITSLPELLRRIDGYAGRPETIAAMKLMLRTFPRTNELRWAQWSEFDLESALWRIPAQRMKGRVLAKQTSDAHLVPLSHQVVSMLHELKILTGRYAHLFPGTKNPATTPISSETINKALKIMGYEGEQTGHGFRGLASTLLNESGLFREEAIEAQLAHKKQDKVASAYNHAVYLDERRALMQWWSDYLDEQKTKAESALA